jgi:hypothetical protein
MPPPAQGEIDDKPRPVPNKSNVIETAEAVMPPAKIAGQDNPLSVTMVSSRPAGSVIDIFAISQCQRSKIKMITGMGTPRSQSKIAGIETISLKLMQNRNRKFCNYLQGDKVIMTAMSWRC